MDKQDGRAFAGFILGSTAIKEAVVGAFRADGRRFVLSTDNGSATGEVTGSEIELCWTDSAPSFIKASCQTYQRKEP